MKLSEAEALHRRVCASPGTCTRCQYQQGLEAGRKEAKRNRFWDVLADVLWVASYIVPVTIAVSFGLYEISVQEPILAAVFGVVGALLFNSRFPSKP